MASDEANGHPSEPGEQPGPADDPLVALEQRLDRASAAAERLLADAMERLGDGLTGSSPGWAGSSGGEGGEPASDEEEPPPRRRQTPPAGWQQPAASGAAAARGLLGDDGELLLRMLGTLRDRIPPDLQRRLAEAVREVLLALRALIDWYLERSERRRAEPAPIRDIPIL
jgi:hypothetical protein